MKNINVLEEDIQDYQTFKLLREFLSYILTLNKGE